MKTWLVGLGGGVLAAVLLLSWGIALPFLAPVAFAAGTLAPPRPTGLSGALVGLGATLVFVLAQADLGCRDVPGCHGPDNLGWYIVGIATVVAGALTRRGGTPRTAHMIRVDGRPPEPHRPRE